MRSRCANAMRKHIHAILIVPLVIIAMTWPTFARLFDGDEIWAAYIAAGQMAAAMGRLACETRARRAKRPFLH